MAATGERPLSFSRTLSLILALCTIAAAAVVFDEKRDSARLASEVSRLQGAIAEENERISELRAEWSLLDQPGRLQAMVEANPDQFHLGPMNPDQVAVIEDVPWKAVSGPPTSDGAKPTLGPAPAPGAQAVTAGTTAGALAAAPSTGVAAVEDDFVDEAPAITDGAEDH
jgi:hypothetical protein